tara:strand:+ start:4094 stop:4435 length:342 start_codon:yes stop_codon:yes gene_type:complete
MLSKINRFKCKITQQGVELHNKDYLTLKEIADELGLSYSVIANLSINRKPKEKKKKFIYFPIIEIIKLDIDYNEIEKEKVLRAKLRKFGDASDNDSEFLKAESEQEEIFVDGI